jgi:DNA-binding beta-propeller fold protein YncE
MIIVFFTFQAALLLLSAFFTFYKHDHARAALGGVLIVKTNIIWALLEPGLLAVPAVLFSYCGAMTILAFINTVIHKPVDSVNPGKRFYAAMLAALLLVLLFGGCAGQKAAPIVSSELDLKFVPGRLAVADKGEIYISAERERNVYLYGIKSGKKIRTIPAGYAPGEILVKNKKVYIANEKNASITVYDPVSDTAESMDCGGEYPGALALNAEKNLLYVANTGSSNVAIVDLKARSVRKKIVTGRWPSDLYLSPDNKYLYVSCKYTNTVQLIDAEKEQFLFTKIETGVSPVQLIPLDKRFIAIINEWEYVFNQQSAVLIFDTKDYNIETSIRVDGGIFHGVLSKSKNYMYISVPLKDKVIFVDMKKKQVVHSMEFKDAAPRWMALSKDGGELYVAAPNLKKILVISVKDLL